MTKHRRLAKIWRAIARRWCDAHLHNVVIDYHAGDDDMYFCVALHGGKEIDIRVKTSGKPV
jgi:hypothetical protein